MNTKAMKCNQKLVFIIACEDRLKLSAEARAKHYHVLFALLRCCNQHTPAKCWPSLPTIARRTHYGVTTVKAVLADLTRWGAVSAEHRFNSSNVYTIHWKSLEGAADVANALKKQGGNIVDALGADIVAASAETIVDISSADIGDSKSATKVLEEKEMNSSKASSTKEKVLHIWQSWNEAIASSTQFAGTPVPSCLTSINGDVNANTLLRAISTWIQANPDWRERWQMVLDEIPINRWFKGFSKSNGILWHPTLSEMFVAKSGYFKKGVGFVAGKGKDIGVERVLSGEFEPMRLTTAVNTKNTAHSQSAVDIHAKRKGFSQLGAKVKVDGTL